MSGAAQPHVARPPGARGAAAPAPRAPAADGTGSARGTDTADGAAAVRAVLERGGPSVVFQPQLSLSRLAVAGYEALARFPQPPHRGPDQWFALAREVGLGAELEASALRQALRQLGHRPAGTTLAVNVSPSVLGSAELDRVLPDDLRGIELELTEHEHVGDVDRHTAAFSAAVAALAG